MAAKAEAISDTAKNPIIGDTKWQRALPQKLDNRIGKKDGRSTIV